MTTIELPAGFEFEFLDEQVLNDNQQDASFYVGYDNLIAEIKGNGKRFQVFCVGEMRILYKDEIYRSTNHLLKDAQITNDKQLFDLERSGELEFINNAWFEFSNADDIDDYSDPLHEAREAILEAIKVMQQ
jgi:hypothetical protein